MMFAQTGPYLAFRRFTDDKIWIGRIDKNKVDKVIPEFTIPLKQLFMSPEDISQVNFFAVPKSAFQNVKYLKGDGDIQMYDNML